MHYMIETARQRQPVVADPAADVRGADRAGAPTLRELGPSFARVAADRFFFGLATVYWIGTPDLLWYLSTSA